MTTRQDALSLAAALNPGILARAIECEKHVAAHPYNRDATEFIRRAGEGYRRKLGEVADMIEPVLVRRDRDSIPQG